jgi:hypothetical protein
MREFPQSREFFAIQQGIPHSGTAQPVGNPHYMSSRYVPFKGSHSARLLQFEIGGAALN